MDRPAGAPLRPAAADRIVNGFCRPFWGWISDHIGRETDHDDRLRPGGLAIFGLITFAQDPVLFVIFTAFTFFGWGEIYSLMPATSGDLFGRKYATTNYGFLYTAKGTASRVRADRLGARRGQGVRLPADIMLLLGATTLVVVLLLSPRLGWPLPPSLKLGFALVGRRWWLMASS